MQDLIKNIKEYIIVIAPSVVSVITMIASILTAIFKCNNVSRESLNKINNIKDEVAKQIGSFNAILNENAELKKLIASGKDLINDLNAKVEEAIKEAKGQEAIAEDQAALIEKQTKEIDTIRKQLTAILKKGE